MTVLEPVIQFISGYQKQTVTLTQVTTGADRPRKPVLRVMDRLVREGYLEEIEDNREMKGYRQFGPELRNPAWKILSKPLAGITPKRPKKRTVRDRIWHLIRSRRRFTRADLQRLASTSIASAEDYTKLLERDGYIRVIGKDGRRKVYLLIKDPGPVRPVIKEKTDD